MPRASTIQGDFSAGELSPLMYARVDAEKYKKGVALGLNWISLIQGGITRRPGSLFCGEVKFSNKTTRIYEFQFSVEQAYLIEFGNLYVRFYKDGDLIILSPQSVSGVTNASPGVFTSASHGYSNNDRVVLQGFSSGFVTLTNREFIVANVTTNTFTLKDAQTSVPIDTTSFGSYVAGGTVAKVYEIVTPYTDSDVMQLKFTQSEDVLYVVHPNYPPAKLIRSGDTNWSYGVIQLVDGPYGNLNGTSTTLTPDAPIATQLTASSVTGINGGSGFLVTDVGRHIRLFASDSKWYWFIITGRTSSTVVTGFLGLAGSLAAGVLPGTTAILNWRLGVFSKTTGYPSCCGFHEQRLIFGGSLSAPQQLDGSVTDSFENFAPTQDSGTVKDSNAFQYDLDSNDVNTLRWISTDEKGLLSGTAGGEWFIRPASTEAGLTPTNVNAKESTTWGTSAYVDAVKIGRTHLHINRTGRKLRELTYNFYVDGFDSQDMTVLSEHITGKGVVQMTYQESPQTIVWAVREDGVLLSMTYNRDGQNVSAGWYRHILGGASDAAGTAPIVESVACIPAQDQSFDELYVVVRRWVNGRTARFIERLTKIFESFDNQEDAVMLDAATSYDNPVSITAINNVNPPTVTAAGHGLSTGDKVIIREVVGMTELNGNIYTVTVADSDNFSLDSVVAGHFNPYTSGGKVRKLNTELQGLNYLEGETVSLLGDGAVLNPVTVINGAILLSHPSATVQIGLTYNSDCQLMRGDSGAADGTAMGKTRRINRVGFLLHRSSGLKFGAAFDALNEITFRTATDPAGQAVPLYSGLMSETVDFNYDFENQLCLRVDEPLPCTILGIMPQVETQDRG